MIRRVLFIIILSSLVASCGPAAAATEAPATEAPAATEPPATEFPLVVESSPTLEPSQTSTPEATLTPPATLTETPLPPLDLPTEIVNAPASLVWDGNPTYPGDSQPGYSFRVTYDPEVWALTNDQFGYPALGHRTIEYCVIAVTSGRGLPQNMTVEHDILYLEDVFYDVSVAYENGVKKFVAYIGGDKVIFTGFEVTFQDQSDQCLVDAETVLSTLRSVPTSQATPVP